MARPLDHLVLATRDLTASAEFYRSLGFQVGGRNRHPWGTENHIVQLPGSFLELVGLGAGFRRLDPLEDAAPFANPLADYLATREGLAMLALRSADAGRDAADFAAAGIGRGRRLHFARSAEAPDGTRREVAFTLAFAALPEFAGCGFFTCQQLRPENFWNPAAQRHPNGACGLCGVTLLAPDPARHAESLGRLFGWAAVAAAPGGLAVDTGGGALDVLTPAEFARRYGVAAVERGGTSPAFAAARIAVRSLDALRSCWGDAGMVFDSVAGRLVVRQARGLALMFEGATEEL